MHLLIDVWFTSRIGEDKMEPLATLVEFVAGELLAHRG
jgi:hypothetical protein